MELVSVTRAAQQDKWATQVIDGTNRFLGEAVWLTHSVTMSVGLVYIIYLFLRPYLSEAPHVKCNNRGAAVWSFLLLPCLSHIYVLSNH